MPRRSSVWLLVPLSKASRNQGPGQSPGMDPEHPFVSTVICPSFSQADLKPPASVRPTVLPLQLLLLLHLYCPGQAGGAVGQPVSLQALCSPPCYSAQGSPHLTSRTLRGPQLPGKADHAITAIQVSYTLSRNFNQLLHTLIKGYTAACHLAAA